MSLTTTLTLGTALGGAAAVAIYTAVVPTSAAPVARTQPVSIQAVPTPTKTVLEPCDKGAVLVKGTCVVHVPGAVVAASAGRSTWTRSSSSGGSTSAATTAPAAPAAASHESDHEDHDGSEPGDD